jgi:hypothetical protein
VPGGFPLESGELAESEFGDTYKSISLNLCKSSSQFEATFNKYHLSINVCWIDLQVRPPQTPLHCAELLYKQNILFSKAAQINLIVFVKFVVSDYWNGGGGQ